MEKVEQWDCLLLSHVEKGVEGRMQHAAAAARVSSGKIGICLSFFFYYFSSYLLALLVLKSYRRIREKKGYFFYLFLLIT